MSIVPQTGSGVHVPWKLPTRGLGAQAPMLETPGLACLILELAGSLGDGEGLPVLSGVP